VKAFSALPLHSELYQWHHKSAVRLMLISVEVTGKKRLKPAQLGLVQSLTHRTLLKKNPSTTPTGMLRNCREKKPHVGSPYFGPFPSVRIPMVSKDVNVHFFIQ